ncbi:MAG: hypothetical protein COW02_11615 [Comamonadaceae bacterium CG12_big_fil_rev_8_21_14_0_65_59_15]|nr:MAG: hypothetical protein COW02_11615 [Comamonadaceae bacterium CG12_big_fil_rev_8_21_14_0_65_59_15]
MVFQFVVRKVIAVGQGGIERLVFIAHVDDHGLRVIECVQNIDFIHRCDAWQRHQGLNEPQRSAARCFGAADHQWPSGGLQYEFVAVAGDAQRRVIGRQCG